MSDKVTNNEEQQRFEVELGGSTAIAAYHREPGKIVFTHTEVPPAHEGQGIGTKLIQAGLHFAREQQLKVVPVCRFFAAYMKSHREVQDLLDPEWREKLGLDQGE